MKIIINRIMIALYAIFLHLKNKIHCSKTDEKIVLIVFQQVFGDSVILSSALSGYMDLYSKGNGYRVIFLARPYILNFMEQVLPLPRGMEFVAVDFKRLVNEFAYFTDIIHKYGSLADTIIVPGDSLSVDLFATASAAKRRIGLVKPYRVSWPPHMAIFDRLAFNEEVTAGEDMMMLQRHRLLLNYLGNKAFKGHLPTLLEQNQLVKDKKYVTMCLGSSLRLKCWPVERFAQVADLIVEKYALPIYLCGGADE